MIVMSVTNWTFSSFRDVIREFRWLSLMESYILHFFAKTMLLWKDVYLNSRKASKTATPFTYLNSVFSICPQTVLLYVPTASQVWCYSVCESARMKTEINYWESYTASFKLDVIMFTEENGGSDFESRDFLMQSYVIRYWKNHKDNLWTMKKGS